MPLRRTRARLLLLTSLAAGGLVASSAPARADFHLMKVREVFGGGSGGGYSAPADAQFIELQMYATGQNMVATHSVVVYNGIGTPVGTFTFPSNVTNGTNQAHILLATTAAQTYFGVAPDLAMSSAPIDRASGAACFESIDCVSWGTFSGTLPSSAGNPFSGGIPIDQSIDRKIAGGTSSTTLDAGDDTNDSANDFQAASPSPTNNAGATVGGGGGGAGSGTAAVQSLRARVRGGKAIIRGQITPPYPGETVSLTFFANGSPLRKVAKKNATLDADSRFKKGFRVPGESTRCKVKVRFRGDPVGQKAFRC